jgi:hypothetical protein
VQRSRRKARANVQALLEPGEQIHVLFMSQTGPSPRGALSVGLTANLMAYWTVAVTDRNVVICSNAFKKKPLRLPLQPMEILEEKSRRWWFPIKIGGTRHWVSTEEYDVVVAANEILRAGQSMPPAPAAPAPAAPATEPAASTPGQPPPPPPPPPLPLTPAAWYPDPSGRHQQRYWDGQGWTPQVADQGAQSTDPAETR